MKRYITLQYSIKCQEGDGELVKRISDAVNSIPSLYLCRHDLVSDLGVNVYTWWKKLDKYVKMKIELRRYTDGACELWFYIPELYESDGMSVVNKILGYKDKENKRR